MSGTVKTSCPASKPIVRPAPRLTESATATARWVDAVAGTGAIIRDTRKTTPGWRELEKYAVRCGGCFNHRSSLGEHVLIKDNHIAAAGSLTRAVQKCRSEAPHGAKIDVAEELARLVTHLAEVERVLAKGGDEVELYERATDVLVALHCAPDHGLLPGLGAYLGEGLIEAAMLLPEWYLPEASGRPTPEPEADAYRAAWRQCLARLPAGGDTLLLRDYHKDNLLWLPARPGVKACGLLDFQDAQRGHASYDLVSLIEDARRDVSPIAYERCLARYIAETGLDAADFRTGFALMAAQRHARVIGLFVRLWRRDGKPDYLVHLPRVWRLFERALRHEALAPLRLWVDRLLPPALRRIGAS